MNKYKQSPQFVKARKRVDNIKKFYKHLTVFIVINSVLLIAKFKLFDFFTQQGVQDQGFYDWLNWNIIGTPVVWGIGLLLHGIYVFRMNSRPLKDFKPRFVKNWEMKKMEEFLREEKRNDIQNGK